MLRILSISMWSRLSMTLMMRCVLLFCLLWSHSLAFATEAPIDISNILQLDDQTKAILDRDVRPVRDQEQRVVKLHDVLFSQLGYAIGYDFNLTHTAQQTFDKRVGNCVSLSNLYVAAARYVGLNAKFQKVKVPRDWEKTDQFYVLPEHMNVVVKLRGGSVATVELISTTLYSAMKGKVISDEQAFAEFYSNRGIELLAVRNIDSAIAHLEKAVAVYPDLASGWSNLGVAYKFQNRLAEAEKAYLKALGLDSHEMSTLKNLYTLYRELGAEDKIASLVNRVTQYANKNPFHLAASANLLADQHNYSAAIRLYQQAMRKKPKESEFHFGLASTYYRLGEVDLAEQSLRLAVEHAQTGDKVLRYKAKLEAIHKIQTQQHLLKAEKSDS